MINKLVLSLALAATPALAGVPVTPAQDQGSLLTSYSVQLANNKQLVYDFWRTVLLGRHLDQAATYLSQDYVQHNPNVPTGLQGFLDYFAAHAGPPTDIPATIDGLVTIRTEGDLVILAFVDDHGTYTTTWFDMFRVKDGKIVEHWDNATQTPGTLTWP